ncbi:MAG: GGDEF domain-containing protein [Candidatus Aminicenantes bacterium]|nr:GGDEF domain-containing protein [Candidatus Aminicenantes bacterium]
MKVKKNLKKFKHAFPHFFKMPEDERRAAKILITIIFAVLAAYLVVIFTSLLRNDWKLTWFALGGVVLQIVPLGFIARGHLRAGGFIAVLGLIVTVTMMATIGQGIHDIAIMAFPVIIIIISSLMMPRRGFIFFSFLTIAAVGWLVFGEVYGLLIPRSLETTNWVDFLLMTAILLVATFTINLMATNMRESLEQARQEIEQRKILEEQLRNQSNHDALTGIYNRAFFEEELGRLDRSREFPISVFVVDVDDLKLVNDTRGHAAGDEFLKRTAAVLQSTFRASDILARIGGDEFAVLLPNTDLAIAQMIMTRIIEKLAEHNVEYPDFPVLLSIGVATAQKSQLAEALAIADQRMYEEKQAHDANS